jgi:transcriptional regulator with PAS, ATPase and Fis domain
LKAPFREMVGKSRGLTDLIDAALRLASTDVTILITGESGTGKELLARGIHAHSPRSQGPFVTVNCVAIPHDLFESELFGHTKGSFTGATANKAGKAELAQAGTLFLDEVGELPLATQGKLLRLVQHHEIEKIGANAPLSVDTRFVAATNRDLEAMVRAGQFREDLYYRLAIVPLRLPALRERVEDIPLLVQHFFQLYRERHRRNGLRLSSAAADRLANGYPWPGNIRELQNVVERSVLLTHGESVEPVHLPPHFQHEQSALEKIELRFPAAGVCLESVERELIRQALTRAEGNSSQAARLLRITRKALLWRASKYGIAV